MLIHNFIDKQHLITLTFLHFQELIKEAETTKKEFRSFEELKKDFDELELNMETDMDTLTRLIEQYRLADSDSHRITLLEDLEYLVHQFDNAITFVDLGKGKCI